MIKDQAYILQQIADMADRCGVDAVLIAGDVYDRNVPSEEAVKLLDGFLNSLVRMGCRVFMISGNHDSDVRLQFAGRLLERTGVYIAGSYEGSVPSVTLTDDFGPVQIQMLPFIKASLVRHYYPDEDIPDYDAAVRAALQHAETQEETRDSDGMRAARRVLLAHQFVTAGETDPSPGGSEDSLLHVGSVERVRSDCFDGYDYVALGHIHRPQRAGRETVRYSGAPLKYSVSEAGQEKSVVLVTLEEKGNVDITLLPLKPLRDLRHIKGQLDDLLNPEYTEDSEDYIYATLTDEMLQYDAINRLRAHYPNILKMDYDNSHTRQIGMAAHREAQDTQTFEEIVTGFFNLIEGREPDEAEWKILREVYEDSLS